VALTLESVCYEYAAGTPMAQPALSGIGMRVQRGELAVVLGPSGSGKTTLLRLAAGLLEPTGGTVEVDEASPAGGRGRARGFAGIVGIAFQRPETQLFAASVGEDVAFGPRNLGETPDAAQHAARLALEAVGMDPEPFWERSPFTLSGGEARRVALAGVLAMEPAYLLLDEPTAGLDAPGREAVTQAVRAARERAGVVVVTHDPDEFLGEADHVVVLRDGRAAYGGDVAGLLASALLLEDEGAWTPPETVRLQLLAQRAGIISGPPVLNPERAAELIAQAGGRP
jgi:energy-coupling factor transport system ATP-binding protein